MILAVHCEARETLTCLAIEFIKNDMEMSFSQVEAKSERHFRASERFLWSIFGGRTFSNEISAWFIFFIFLVCFLLMIERSVRWRDSLTMTSSRDAEAEEDRGRQSCYRNYGSK